MSLHRPSLLKARYFVVVWCVYGSGMGVSIMVAANSIPHGSYELKSVLSIVQRC